MASNAKLSGRRGLQSRLTGRDLSSGINPARTSKSRNGSEGLLSEEGRAQRSKSSISLRNGVNSRGGKENDPVPLDPRAKALKVAIDVNPEELANWIEMLNYLRKSQLASSGLLIEWYDKAVDELPVEKYRKNHDYFRICMIWASLHKQDGIGEMKSRLRWMMGNRIGLDHAELFVSKAKLEIEEGDYIKAKDTLQKGILRCAQPQSLLDNELKSVEGYITHESSGSKCDRSVNITDEMTSSSRRSTSKGSLHVSGIGRSSHENHDVAPRTSISQSLKQLLVEDDESSDRQASNVQVSVPEMDSEKPAVFPVTNDSSSGNRYVTSRNLNPVDSSKMTPSQAINPVPEQSSHQSKSKPITALEKNVSFSVDDSQKKSKSATELNLIEPANLKNLPLGSKQPSFLLNGHIYQKLELVGKGGSGKVFKVVGENYKIYALKRIKFQPTDVKTIENLKNEMELLKRLKGKPHIIQMYDCQEDYKKGIILMVCLFSIESSVSMANVFLVV